MRIDLPFWVWFTYFDIKFWFLTVPAAIILMLAGWYGAPWLGAVRWMAFAVAALLAIPFPVAGAIVTFGEMRSAAAMRAVSQTLERDETVAGLDLPAGSRISFRDKAHLSIASIDLPGATGIMGINVAGTLVWNEFSQVWSGTLAQHQRLDGWPCHEGPAEFDSKGVILKCDLAEAHVLLGYALPPGSNVTRGGAGKPWAFRLPPDSGLAVPALDTTAPGGVTLWIANDGRLERINSGHGQTIVVRGVPLNSMNFYLRGDEVVAPLAEALTVAGEVQPAGTGVQIDLRTAEISRAPKNWWLTE